MIFRREYKIEGYVKSDVGTVRENNEDNFLLGRLINRDSRAKQEASFSTWAIGEWNCFGVFDGIGGGEKGELASLFSAQVFEGKGKKLKECHSYKEVELVLQKAFLEANNRIILAGRNSPVCGTTGTILVTDGIAAKVFHVGDSRCCLCREGENYRLTKDQTTAQLKQDIGIYRSLEEATQRERHQLTEYIGRDLTQESLSPEEGEWIDFRERDVFLLSSDGFHDFCDPEDTARILSQGGSVREMADTLLAMALQKESDDNLTVMLVRKIRE